MLSDDGNTSQAAEINESVLARDSDVDGVILPGSPTSNSMIHKSDEASNTVFYRKDT